MPSKFPPGPPPKKAECCCNGTGCGFVEVPARVSSHYLYSRTKVVQALRAFGAVVHNGLGNRLPGMRVRSCQLDAFRVAGILEKADLG